jgi:3-phosphoshikimate 1-carboxyvinyltransferase
MPNSIEIHSAPGPVHSTIQPPGSKSLTNRALPIAAMAKGRSVLHGVLDSDDTQAMIDSLIKVGVPIEHDKVNHRIEIDGQGGVLPNSSADLFIGNSGTTIRFLTAMLGFAGGDYRLDGIARMRERPIGPLVKSLNDLGASVVAESPNDCPPVRISSPRLKGGTVNINGNISSQYLSGLMMAAPLATEDVVIQIEGPLISKPYVKMTAAVMKSFGVECRISENFDRFEIRAGQTYVGTDYRI